MYVSAIIIYSHRHDSRELMHCRLIDFECFMEAAAGQLHFAFAIGEC